MTELSKEKRNDARIPLDSECMLCLKGTEYRGYVSDISLGGLHLAELQPKLPDTCIGQQGELFFDEGQQKMGIKCETIHMDGSGLGISFCAI